MWQPYTTLEFIYDGIDWVIVGNPTVESYYSSTSSYEVKADGLIEQWGNFNGGSGEKTITFSVQFLTIYYNVNIMGLDSSVDGNSNSVAIKQRSNTSAIVLESGNIGSRNGHLFYVKGY